MLASRLSVALEQGALTWPETGDIAVFHPLVDADLSDLPRDRVVVIQRDFVAHEAFAGQGYRARVAPEGSYAAAIVCLPRSKALGRALVGMACAHTDGPVVIDGQKTDGVDSMLKSVRARHDASPPISKAHGKLFWMASSDVFKDWVEGPALTPGGFWTAPGVFSADGIDPASALLAQALPDNLSGQVADLGAGWGFLSAHLMTRPKVKAAHLVEADHIALECARRNVTDPRAHFHWADASGWQAPEQMDAVVMNPALSHRSCRRPRSGAGFYRGGGALPRPARTSMDGGQPAFALRGDIGRAFR